MLRRVSDDNFTRLVLGMFPVVKDSSQRVPENRECLSKANSVTDFVCMRFARVPSNSRLILPES